MYTIYFRIQNTKISTYIHCTRLFEVIQLCIAEIAIICSLLIEALVRGYRQLYPIQMSRLYNPYKFKAVVSICVYPNSSNVTGFDEIIHK